MHTDKIAPLNIWHKKVSVEKVAIVIGYVIIRCFCGISDTSEFWKYFGF